MAFAPFQPAQPPQVAPSIPPTELEDPRPSTPLGDTPVNERPNALRRIVPPSPTVREPMGLPPAAFLLGYCHQSRLPALPSHVQLHIERKMSMLNEYSETMTPGSAGARTHRTRLTAKSRAGDRVLAEIERIDIKQLMIRVLDHGKRDIPGNPADFQRVVEAHPRMFIRAPGLSHHSQTTSTNGSAQSIQNDENQPPQLPVIDLTINLPAEGFKVDGTLPEFQPSPISPWSIGKSRDTESSEYDQARALLTQGTLRRSGTGLESMLGFAESLDEALLENSSSSSSSGSSLQSLVSHSSIVSSVRSVSNISWISHMLKSTLLPTAASVIKVAVPVFSRGWRWMPLDDASSGEEVSSDDERSVFGAGGTLSGWDVMIWGNEAGENSMLFAIQPPWHMPTQNFHDFTQSQEFTDGVRDEETFLSYEKLWATIYDFCRGRKIRHFVITTYENFVFGGFTEDFKFGFATPPVSSVPVRTIHEASVLQILVYWTLMSMKALVDEAWLTDEFKERLDRRSAQQVDLGVIDEGVARAPTPPPWPEVMTRVMIERETNEPIFVNIGEWAQRCSLKRPRSVRDGSRGGERLSTHNVDEADADDEGEVENYLGGSDGGEQAAPTQQLNVDGAVYHRLGNHLIRMDSLSTIDPHDDTTSGSDDAEFSTGELSSVDSQPPGLITRPAFKLSTPPRKVSDRSTSLSSPNHKNLRSVASSSKISSATRVVKEFPKRKGNTSTKVRFGVAEDTFNSFDNNRRQRADGSWEINMDGDDSMELDDDVNNDDWRVTVTGGSPISRHTRLRTQARRSLGTDIPAPSTQPRLPTRRSTRHSAPMPHRRVISSSTATTCGSSSRPSRRASFMEEDDDDEPANKKKRLFLVVSSESGVKTRNQRRLAGLTLN